MIYDSLGCPRDSGSTDFQDSARLAGLCSLLKHGPRPPLQKYVDEPRATYLRHPTEHRYDFSRDQALCLVAGLWAANLPHLVRREYVTGKDWFSPSHYGHFARCSGSHPTLLQRAWLWVDVAWHAFCNPEGESNQLISMLLVAPPIYMCTWMRWNKRWQWSVTKYWCGWRNEPQLASKILEATMAHIAPHAAH